MFFKKRREAAEAKAAQAKQEILRTLDTRFDEAMQSRDPAEKIIKLEDQKQAIDTFVDTAKGDIKAQAKGKWLGGYFGATIGSNLAIDIVSVALTGFPASVLFIVPSIILGWMTGDKRVEKAKEKLENENAEFFGTMNVDMRDFAESPKFSQLLERVPSLRQKFAESYRRHVDGTISDVPDSKKKNNPDLHL